jgi:hypothetical protein
MNKTYTFLVASLLFSALASAQTIDVNGLKTDSDSSTTIKIEKGKPGETAAEPKKQWEVQDGTADVEGETSATAKDAKTAWKKACDDWKKEFREDNKENKILSMSCGSANCSGEAGSKICTSRATFKVKTRVD